MAQDRLTIKVLEHKAARLSYEDIDYAIKVGDGNFSAGLRQCIRVHRQLTNPILPAEALNDCRKE